MYGGKRDPSGASSRPKKIQRAARVFRQPVVRSGGAAHRLAAPTQPTPFLAAESLVAPASPSPTKDAFWSDDNTRNTNGGFFVASSHGTRSRDRGTRDEWIRSPALHRVRVGSEPLRERPHAVVILSIPLSGGR